MPDSARGKKVYVRGNVWAKNSFSHKTSANSMHLVINNDYSIAIELYPTSRTHTAWKKIAVDKTINNFANPVKLSTWQSGSANAPKGWDPSWGCDLDIGGELEFYWN